MSEAVRALVQTLSATAGSSLTVVTGAGVSRASGIPTFRGSEPEAVWRRDDIELATFAYFQRDPVGQWLWYLKRFDAVDGARPNPAHHALAALERWQLGRGGRFLLVTQNIDTLHEQAGSRELVKVHGSSDRLRCAQDGCMRGAPRGSLPRAEIDLDAFRRRPALARLPRCPDCGELLRAHVLFFDEYYQGHEDYEFDRVAAAAEKADCLLFVGTSFSVGVTDLFLRSALLRGVPALSIDPGGAPSPAGNRLIRLAEPAEEILPQACAELGAPLPHPAR